MLRGRVDKNGVMGRVCESNRVNAWDLVQIRVSGYHPAANW